jgi:regulator of nucleoside diphosphate kinase
VALPSAQGEADRETGRAWLDPGPAIRGDLAMTAIEMTGRVGGQLVPEGDICITAVDRDRLETLMSARSRRSGSDQGPLEALEREIDRARVVTSREIPPDVVTMNSRVKVCDLDAGAEMELTLVYPLGANSRIGRVSVLAPIGMALLGSRAGDTVVWRVPSGMRRLRIERVLYQPEAAGHFQL